MTTTVPGQAAVPGAQDAPAPHAIPVQHPAPSALPVLPPLGPAYALTPPPASAPATPVPHEVRVGRQTAGARREPAWRVLVRAKLLVLTIVVVVAGATAVLSTVQTPVYSATATLVVNQPVSDDASFDVIQANQAFARTLARLIGSRNVADVAARRLPFAMVPTEVQEHMSFTPVNETQLIEVTAQDADPAVAQALANTYAETFVDYVEAVLPKAAPSSGLSLADRAVRPQAPTRPRPTLYTLVALVLATAGAVGLVLVRARLDTRFADADALAAEFDLPVLGVLPRVDRGAVSERRFEEAVRLLCTTLQHVSDRPLRAMVVTSSREGEGKSTVSAELAGAFASLSLVEAAVLAVDADLRRPRLHLRAGLGEEVGARRGLATYLSGERDAEECIVETALPSLRVLPAGPLPSHPSTLLGFASSRTAIDALREHGQVVVFDTPPLDVGADASILATQADAVLLVVDLARSREPELRASLEQLARVGVTPLGFVVNRSTQRLRSSSSYYDLPAPAQHPA